MARLKPLRKTPLNHAGFAVMRSPLLPASTLWNWSKDLALPRALLTNDAHVDSAAEADRERLVAGLRDLLSDDLVSTAIYIAAPNLVDLMNEMIGDRRQKQQRKLTATLTSYLLRMAYRPTPFGCFAGSTTLEVGQTTALTLKGAEYYRTHSRLDVVYLAALSRKLSESTEIREALTYRRNPGLYEVAGEYRIAELEAPDERDMKRVFHLVSFDATDPLRCVLLAAEKGASLRELATVLTSSYSDVSFEDARTFVEDLRSAQLLIPDLEPRVTGGDSLEGIVAKLFELDDSNPTAALLRSIESRLKQVDEQNRLPSMAAYQGVTDDLGKISPEISSKHMLHVDLYKPAEKATIGPNLIRAVREGVQLLHHLCPPMSRQDLSRFVTDFQARYQDREVPLMEALDEESGIGFGRAAPEQSENSPLLADLGLSRRSQTSVEWSEREARLLRLLGGSLHDQSNVLELTQQDLDALSATEVRPLPDSLAANVTVLASSTDAVERNDFKLLWHGAFGPSGALYLGRFCHGDSQLRSWVERHLVDEERHHPEAIFAEITHLPQTRIGNVICRPSLRAYEIPYHGGSGVPHNQQIPVSDLQVRIDDGRIVLRSARLDREVIPRLTTAHNAGQAELGPYRFLCALQTQGVCHWLAWDWGPLESAIRLPRVEAGRLILARARWRLDKDMLRGISGKTSGALMRSLAELRECLGLPRWIQVVQADRLLPLDLDNILCAELFCRLARRQQILDLTELLPTPDLLCVQGPDGLFNHELIIPFTQPVQEAESRHKRRLTKRPAKLFTPGSEWLYVKIYTGISFAEALLSNTLATFIAQERARTSFDSWFFLRFADPQPHLRLRFHGDPRELQQLWTRLQDTLQPHLDVGSMSRIQLDTYDPEIERYGGEQGLALSHAVFDADSDASLRLLHLIAEDESRRWQYALLSVHRLFEDLGIELNVRVQQLEGMRTLLLSEFEFGESGNRALSRQHRTLRPAAEAILSPPDQGERSELQRVLDERGGTLTRAGVELGKLANAAGTISLSRSVGDLAISYAHMSANRLLRTAARAQELVLYDLLIGHYRTSIAQQG